MPTCDPAVYELLARRAYMLGVTVDPLPPNARRVDATRIEELYRCLTGPGRDRLGLHVAQTGRPGDLGVVDYLLRHCGTLGEAFHVLTRYVRILHDGWSLTVGEQGSSMAISLAPQPSRNSSRAAVEWGLARIVLLARELTGERFVPTRVRFWHAPPPDVREYREAFGCPVHFRQQRNEIIVPREAFALPIADADPRLWSVLTRCAEGVLADLPRSEDLLLQLRGAILTELECGGVTLHAVAKRMRVSTRTLQRRLRELGTTHKTELDRARSTVARRLLRDQKLAVGEAAHRLGYSEPSTFHRAFKRWTGQTPGAFRARPPMDSTTDGAA